MLVEWASVDDIVLEPMSLSSFYAVKIVVQYTYPMYGYGIYYFSIRTNCETTEFRLVSIHLSNFDVLMVNYVRVS